MKGLARKNILEVKPYVAGKPIEETKRQLGLRQVIKLASNENPLGPSPKAVAAVKKALAGINRYPDSQGFYLKKRIARSIGVEPSNIILGNGSDELIDLTMRLFVIPGDAVVNLPPTFGMYSYNTSLCAARLTAVPRRDDFSVDVEAVECAVGADARAKIMFVNSPNNPDGSLIGPADLKRLLALPLIVVLDEAYG